MRRLAVLVSCATLAVAAVSADAADPSFRQGVAAGEMTTTSATLWTRAPRPGAVLLTVSTSTSVPVGRFAVRADTCERPDGSARRPQAEGRHEVPLLLHPGQGEERHRFVHDRAGCRGSLPPFGSRSRATRTRPLARTAVLRSTATRSTSACAPRRTTSTSISATRSTRTARWAARRSRAPSREKWAKYRLGLALPALWALRASAGLYSHWDDHEFINDFSRRGARRRDLRRRRQGVPRLLAGRRTRRRQGSTARSAGGSTSSSSSSTSARSAARRQRRSAAAISRRPRLRPCATRSPRSLRPSQPGPARLSRRDRRSGANDARRAPVRDVHEGDQASTATWKVIVNEVPIQQYYALPYDRWEGYAAERERLLRFLQANVKNVVFLTTDTHGNLVNEVRSRTLSARRRATGSGRSSRARSRRTRSRRRSTASSARKAPARRSVRSSSSPRRRTGWACAAPRSTRTATRR